MKEGKKLKKCSKRKKKKNTNSFLNKDASKKKGLTNNTSRLGRS